MAVPHTIEGTRLLRNLGVTAPAPIQYYYDWAGGKPFDSQRKTADLLSTSRRAYVLNEMGTGKTRSALYAYDFLRREGHARRALIVAPLSTLVSVWENEIFENFHHLSTVVLHGSREKRKKLLAVDADCYIINHDGVAVIQEDLVKRGDLDCIILDELAVYRNARAERSKAVRPLVQAAAYAWGLTGQPTPNEPTDAYGQVRLITPESVSFSFKAYRESVMQQVSQFRWIPKQDANDTVYKLMQPSIRVTRAECFDLPPVTYSNRQVAIDPRAAKAYKTMMDELAVAVKSTSVTAANEGVKLSKLLQISAGFVYDGDGKGHYIGGLGRIKTVFEIVEESKGKLIVFAPFKFLVSLYGAALAKRYTVETITGDTPKSSRDRIFTSFQRSDAPRIIVAHPATMSHGLTLTAADTIVWTAPITSLETYEQANARITRPGQTDHAHIIHVMSTQAEAQVYARLRRKAKMQGALLELFESHP
jgi:SNF2 family DNA or RNA helicase